jgi:hypothetical protein
MKANSEISELINNPQGQDGEAAFRSKLKDDLLL